MVMKKKKKKIKSSSCLNLQVYRQGKKKASWIIRKGPFLRCHGSINIPKTLKRIIRCSDEPSVSPVFSVHFTVPWSSPWDYTFKRISIFKDFLSCLHWMRWKKQKNISTKGDSWYVGGATLASTFSLSFIFFPLYARVYQI